MTGARSGSEGSTAKTGSGAVFADVVTVSAHAVAKTTADPVFATSLRRVTRRVAGVAAAQVALLALVLGTAPAPPDGLSIAGPSRVVLDDRGQPLWVDVGGRSVCLPVALDDMAEALPRAIVAAEDQRFWRHGGFDGVAIARATWSNATALRRVSGASTLTMQLARMRLGLARGWTAKAREAWLALALERDHDKRTLLQAYLNQAPFGGALRGVEAAAWRYFGTSARRLSLGQAALLAGLPQSPSRLRPDRHPAAAYARRSRVLACMVAAGLATADEARRADAERYGSFRHALPREAPHYCRALGDRGTSVHTGIARDLQRAVERAVASGTSACVDVGGGAALVYDLRTERVAAWVGSVDFEGADAGQVDALLRPRSPGSCLKPLLYALAWSQGASWPDEVLHDVPRRFGDYRPENADGAFIGARPAQEMLARSRNVPAVALLERLGAASFARTLADLGVARLAGSAADRHGLALALGAAEMTPWALARVYALLAREGLDRPLRRAGEEPLEPCERRLVPGAAWMTSTALASHSPPGEPRFAWKTGTSWGRRDAWCAGHDGRWVVVVWLGNPSGAPARALAGATAALPVARRIAMALAELGLPAPIRPRPDDVERRVLCASSGAIARPCCPRRVEGDWLRGVREVPCAVHRAVARRDDDGAMRMETVEDWPPSVARWRSVETTGEGLVITSPLPRTAYRRSNGPARIALVACGGRGTLHWYAGARHLGESAPGAALSWTLEPGRHALVVADADGRTARVEIAVE